MTTCTQSAADGCATDPALGTCPACGFVFHDIPSHADDAHGELCCGGTDMDACLLRGEPCVTHGVYAWQHNRPGVDPATLAAMSRR